MIWCSQSLQWPNCYPLTRARCSSPAVTKLSISATTALSTKCTTFICTCSGALHWSDAQGLLHAVLPLQVYIDLLTLLRHVEFYGPSTALQVFLGLFTWNRRLLIKMKT